MCTRLQECVVLIYYVFIVHTDELMKHTLLVIANSRFKTVICHSVYLHIILSCVMCACVCVVCVRVCVTSVVCVCAFVL